MKYICIIFVFLAACVYGEIKTIKSFSEIDISQLTSKSLVIFDVDEVLISPADAILTHSARNYRSGMWSSVFYNNELFGIILNTVDYTLIDPYVIKLMSKLRDKGIPFIALTAANTGKIGPVESLVEWRIAQLAKLGITFDFFYQKHHSFNHLVGINKNPPIYKNGILFCGDLNQNRNCKGYLLQDFFRLVGWEPDHVVFIDDFYNHLLSVQDAIALKNITYQGYHFTGTYAPQFDPEVVELQVNTILNEKIWLTDEEAREILEKRSRAMETLKN